MTARTRWAWVIGALAAVLVGIAAQARAAVRTEAVDYKIGNGTFEGFLAYDDAIAGKRPGIVISPAWMGISQNERKHARMLAALGYVAFVADIYGKGVHPATPRAAAAESGKFIRDRALYRTRASAALAVLKRSPAMGYCFGGMGGLELGRRADKRSWQALRNFLRETMSG